MVTSIDDVKIILFRDYNINGPYQINPVTLVVDVMGDVALRAWKNDFEVQFGRISGSFTCNNKRIQSLKGAPHHVGGEFDCASNRLSSLDHGPQFAGAYNCNFQQIGSLEGAPTNVSGMFQCRNNQITSLAHAPSGISFLDCQSNPLVNFEGMPSNTLSISCSWKPDLPLLRLLSCDQVYLGWECPQVVNEIMTTYAGEGKPGALKAAAELIKAGYKESARW
jgi:hypothetical protein